MKPTTKSNAKPARKDDPRVKAEAKANIRKAEVLLRKAGVRPT